MARKSGDLKNMVEPEREPSGAGAEREQSGERAESAAHNPLKPNNWLISLVNVTLILWPQ